MRNRLNDCEDNVVDAESEESLPIEHLYTVGVDACIQVIDVGALISTPGLLTSIDGTSSYLPIIKIILPIFMHILNSPWSISGNI